jgi:hypothetical protein
MSNIFLERTIKIFDGKSKKDCHLKISKPSIDDDEFFCEVSVVPLLSNTKRIFGVSAVQASELTLDFLKKILEDKELYEEHGQPLSLENIFEDS